MIKFNYWNEKSCERGTQEAGIYIVWRINWIFMNKCIFHCVFLKFPMHCIQYKSTINLRSCKCLDTLEHCPLSLHEQKFWRWTSVPKKGSRLPIDVLICFAGMDVKLCMKWCAFWTRQMSSSLEILDESYFLKMQWLVDKNIQVGTF